MLSTMRPRPIKSLRGADEDSNGRRQPGRADTKNIKLRKPTTTNQSELTRLQPGDVNRTTKDEALDRTLPSMTRPFCAITNAEEVTKHIWESEHDGYALVAQEAVSSFMGLVNQRGQKSKCTPNETAQ